jgi:uncharacterized protein YktB (UPF0637 family)
MRAFPGFTEQDFDVFAIPTLEGRMEGIKDGPRPKLEALGQDLAPMLAQRTGQEMFAIVARHARRKVNPPSDTWVAWSANKRGYKMLPHFEVGLWQTHAFIQTGMIYEAPGRPLFAENLLANLAAVRAAIPPHFRWLEDYADPRGILHRDMTDEDFQRIAHRLKMKKAADCMVGLSVERGQVVRAGAAFGDMAAGVLQMLLPVYALASGAPVQL